MLGSRFESRHLQRHSTVLPAPGSMFAARRFYQFAVLEQLWKDIADIFRDRGHRLLFEILNEPHTADGSDMPAVDLRSMTGLAYDQIRAVDSERIVLFGGNQWFGAHEVPEVWTNLDEVGGGSDAYLMVTFHHYDPWTFCGDSQGTYDDAWTDANQSEWGVGWGSRYDEIFPSSGIIVQSGFRTRRMPTGALGFRGL